MDPITLHPLVAGAIGSAIIGAFGWLTKYFVGEIKAKNETIKEKNDKIKEAYDEGKKTEVALEAKIEDKNKRIRDLERRLSWFEAKYGDDDSEPPEVTRTNFNNPRT